MAAPLLQVQVDDVFQRGREGGVVDRSDDDQRVGRHESFGEIDHFPGRIRQEGETFLEQRKIVRFQVEYFGFGQFVGRQIVLKIEGDTVTEASRPHAGR